MREVLVKLLVLVVGHFGTRQGPQCRCGIHDLVFVLTRNMQRHRETDVVRIFADQGLDTERLQKLQFVVPEVQRHPCTALPPLDVLDRKFALAIGFPADGLFLPGSASFDGDLVGHNERRVKADAELTNQLRVMLLVTRHLFEELCGSGTRDGAEVIDKFLSRHANTVVDHRQLPILLIDFDANGQCVVPPQIRL